MSFWRQLTGGLRVLTRRAAADQDLADEMREYFEHATAAKIASGLAPDEARRAALLELGNPTVARDEVRSHGWENLIATALTDLRYAARHLRNNPGFAALIVLTLAVSIGASTAIFSAVNPILFKPLLGASPANILRLILRQGIVLTGFGVAIGLGGAMVASRALVSLIFGISRLDPATYLGVIALLMGVSIIACWMPAWRAARVDPAITLRAE